MLHVSVTSAGRVLQVFSSPECPFFKPNGTQMRMESPSIGVRITVRSVTSVSVSGVR